MKTNKYTWWRSLLLCTAILLMGVIGCTDLEPDGSMMFPTLESSGATNVSRTSITVTGSFSGNLQNVSKYGVRYSTSEAYPADQTEELVYEGQPTSGNFTADLTNLEPNTHYYFCLFASTGKSEVTSQSGQFTTTSTSMPIFGEMTVDSLAEDYIRIRCSIQEIGDNYVIEFGASYKTENGPTYIPVAAEKYTNESTREFVVGISGLNAATKYNVRAYAKNAATVDGSDGVKEGYSDMQVITTSNQLSPEVTTNTVSDVGINSAKVTATVTAALGSDGVITERGFCYSTSSTEPTIYDQVQKDKGLALNEAYSYTFTDLISFTTYYIRGYAKNKVGDEERIGYGEVIEFTTLALSSPDVQMGYTDANGKETVTEGLSAGSVTVYALLDNYDKQALVERGFVWSKDDPAINKENAETTGNIITEVSGDKVFHAKITGLTAETFYYIRAYAIYESDGERLEGYSDYITINTPSVRVPTFTNLNLSSNRFATVDASIGISEMGDGTLVEKGFLWKKNDDGNWDINFDNCMGSAKVEDGTNYSYSYAITNLPPNKEILVRAYAKTSVDGTTFVGYSNTYSSWVSSFYVSNMEVTPSRTSITMTVTIADDISMAEEYGFAYYTMDSNGSQTEMTYAKASNLDANNKFTHTIDGLREGTEYFVGPYVKIGGEYCTSSTWSTYTLRAPSQDDNVSPDKKN